MSTKTTIDWLGQSFDSPEEVYFAMWLEELREVGVVKEWKRDIQPINLTDGLVRTYIQTTVGARRTKTELKTQTLLRPSEYTPDFYIAWNCHNNHIWCPLENDGRISSPIISQGGSSYIEVKPTFDQNNMTRLFVINQKFVWDKHNIYINLIKPFELFEKTFTPTQFLLTKTGKPRKIKWGVKTIKEFL